RARTARITRAGDVVCRGLCRRPRSQCNKSSQQDGADAQSHRPTLTGTSGPEQPPNGEVSVLVLGQIGLAAAHEHVLLADVVADGDDALLNARERAGAGVLDHPRGAADRRRAVLPGRAEVALAAAPQAAHLGLGGGRVPGLLLRAG